MSSKNMINIGSDNGLMPDGIIWTNVDIIYDAPYHSPVFPFTNMV